MTNGSLCAICGLDHEAPIHDTRPTGYAVAMERRALIAEADAALAWRRVTELQARGTELVVERRAAHEALARLAREVRSYAATLLPRPFDEHLEAIVARYEGKP